MAAIADAERVQKSVRATLGRREGVRGVGVTWDEHGDARVRVNVDAAAYDEIRKLVHADIDGVTVELRKVGRLKAFSARG